MLRVKSTSSWSTCFRGTSLLCTVIRFYVCLFHGFFVWPRISDSYFIRYWVLGPDGCFSKFVRMGLVRDRSFKSALWLHRLCVAPSLAFDIIYFIRDYVSSRTSSRPRAVVLRRSDSDINVVSGACVTTHVFIQSTCGISILIGIT